ncbi:MAG TPA: helix-turn-helix transcriptional regulator [Clostridiales bacterium]|nr:helix-turn-helix transcriptional regulator [Clostridiales bacterium]
MTKLQIKEMAARIKARREALGFTQESFCEVIDLSASSYTKIENAFQKPSLDTLIRIAGRLDLSLDYIVFGSEERKPKEVLGTDVLKILLESTDSDTLQSASVFLAKAAKIKEK